MINWVQNIVFTLLSTMKIKNVYELSSWKKMLQASIEYFLVSIMDIFQQSSSGLE